MERNDLINDLRALIRSAEGTTTLSPVTPESIPEIHKNFEKVSIWLLCKGEHRSEFGKIVQKWTDELNKVEEAIDLSTTIDIRKELNIQKYEKIFCHGKKKNGGSCSKEISTQNRDYANTIITALGRARDYTPAIEKNILELAHLLMCQGYHQEQAAEKSKEWLEKMGELLIPADAMSAQPSSPQSPSARGQSSTPANNRTGTVDSRRSESVASSVFTGADPIATGTPATSPPSRRQYELKPTATGSPIRPKRATPAPTVVKTELQSMLTTRTAENSTLVIQTEPPVPKSKPFRPKSARAIIARIWARINRPLLPREKQAGTNDLRRELSAISRGFNESIIEIKAEVKEGKPLMQIPPGLQNSSLQIQDPFVEPAVINVPA